MSTIKEDDRIRELFYDIQWHHVQLNDVKVEDKGNFFGIEKESNILSINKRKEYKEVMDKAEDELYWLLDRVNRIEIRESFEGLEYVEELKAIREYYSSPDDIEGDLEKELIEYLRDEEIIDQHAYWYYTSIDGTISDKYISIINNPEGCIDLTF